MPRPGRQPLGLLRLSSKGQYRAQGMGHHAAEGRVRRQRLCLWRPPSWRGDARAGSAHRMPPRGTIDAGEQAAHCLAAQVVHTTDSAHSLPVSDNLLARRFNPSVPKQAWVSDIMYIRTRQGWLYLVVVLDL